LRVLAKAVQQELESEFNSRLAAKAKQPGLTHLLTTLNPDIKFPGSFPKTPEGKGILKLQTPEPKPQITSPKPEKPKEGEEEEVTTEVHHQNLALNQNQY
jgi:hypothetical protein